MKKSILAKAASIILATSLMLGMTACGDSSKADDNGTSSTAVESSSKAEEKQITGETKTWGVFTVLIPEGWKLREGDALNDKDPNYCSVKKSDFSYFDLKSETDEVSKKQYDYNKKTYTQDQKDLPATKVGDIEWNGFEYGGDLNKGFELYATVNGKNIRVSSCGFKFDSPEAKAVLASIKLS
jgi:hypothetical protein